MTAAAFLFLSITVTVAVFDWLAVSIGNRILEYICKPLTMVALVGVALSLDPSSDTARLFLVIGLVLSLAGDVFLMLPSDLFVPGLASFLLAHLAYVVALAALGVGLGGVVTGAIVAAIAAAVVGRRIVAGAAAADTALRLPVIAYMGAISTMVMFAFGTGAVFAVIGALLFFVSDAVLGWTRFVGQFTQSRAVVIVTYHLGQIGLVLALI
ncbi:MAG: hypothetical protein KGR18_01185 [Acidobacteria bacterium]|nr:hypothetical protein [Acidobacteriota bacterium]